MTYVIPFKSRGRLFVEIPEHVEHEGHIVAGESLQLELAGEDIIYHRTTAVARPAAIARRMHLQSDRRRTFLHQHEGDLDSHGK